MQFSTLSSSIPDLVHSVQLPYFLTFGKGPFVRLFDIFFVGSSDGMLQL